MRVLFITNMYPVPDYIYFGIHVREQIESLQRDSGIEADVYFINGRQSKLNYAKSIFGIKKKITSGQYDLIHIHYGISGLFLLYFTPNIPVVITLHSGELFRKKGWVNHMLQKNLTLAIIKKVERIIILNDDMAELLEDHASKLKKLPCGTDMALFLAVPPVVHTGRIVIGFPGNKSRKEKNYILFQEIISHIERAHTVEVIEFHGLTRSEVVENMQQLDFLLMTSTVEGSPQIIKEAMACNRPVISTRVGDVAYLLDDVRNSFVLDCFQVEPFLEPVSHLLNLDPKERISNGRDKLIELGLDSLNVSTRLLAIYNEVV